MDIVLDYEPQPRQVLLHSSSCRQIFYGGAAGGGKSHSLRWDFITLCLKNPGCQAYLFRRTLPELEDNHIKFAKTEIPRELGVYSETRKRMEFVNGSALNFCYAERDDDVYRYLGAEMHAVGLDEASRFTEHIINLLRTRNRIGGWKPSPEYVCAFPRFVLASNPGGPAHNFLKATFIDAGPPEVVFFDPTMRDVRDPNDKGWSSIFIPARMEDNDYLDAGYAAAFSGLPPELAKAYRDGDWDAVVGQALHNLNREKHCLRSFTPPRAWTHFMVMDWGYAKPFSVGWYCVSEGAVLEGKNGWPDRYLPSGSVIRFREYYGGDRDKGLRLDPGIVAKKIVSMEEGLPPMDFRVADNGIWATDDGDCVEQKLRTSEPRLVFRPSKKDRKANYIELVSRLAGSASYSQDGEDGDAPMFYVTENCKHWWRTVPPLTLDETDPEKGPDTRLEDHCYDETVYALRARPYVMTEKDRYRIEFDKARKMTRSGDPYAT